SESGRSSLAVSCDTADRAYRPAANPLLRRDFVPLEVLVRRAVVPCGQRRALAGLALARRRLAPCDAAVERPGLDLLLDEGNRGGNALLDGPGHLGLRRDREVPPDVLEERPVRLGKVERILGEP